MLRRALLLAALAGCSDTVGTPVIDAPDGYSGPVSLTILNHATATHVVSVPAGLDCPVTCTADFPIGSTVTLTLASHASYFVAFYSKPCEKVDGDGFTCRVTLTGATTIEVDGGQE